MNGLLTVRTFAYVASVPPRDSIITNMRAARQKRCHFVLICKEKKIRRTKNYLAQENVLKLPGQM